MASLSFKALPLKGSDIQCLLTRRCALARKHRSAHGHLAGLLLLLALSQLHQRWGGAKTRAAAKHECCCMRNGLPAARTFPVMWRALCCPTKTNGIIELFVEHSSIHQQLLGHTATDNTRASSTCTQHHVMQAHKHDTPESRYRCRFHCRYCCMQQRQLLLALLAWCPGSRCEASVQAQHSCPKLQELLWLLMKRGYVSKGLSDTHLQCHLSSQSQRAARSLQPWHCNTGLQTDWHAHRHCQHQ